MNVSTIGKWLIGIGIIFSVLGLVSTAIPLIGAGVGIIFGSISWILLITGIVLWIFSGRRIAALSTIKILSFNRHDIIKSTNWARLGIVEFVKPIGASLSVIGVLLLILELIFGNPYPLFFLWITIIAIGAILLIWRPSAIIHDHTKKILIKIPDLLSVHTFHTNLRQCLEDTGYAIAQNVSPGEGSPVSSFNNNIFLLKGGIKGLKKSTSPSKLLIPESTNTSIISNIFTLFGLGILLMALGFTLFIHRTTTWQFETWAPILETMAIILLFVGIIILIYDYITRTRRLAEIYIIEEGTVYIPTINIYDPRILEKPGYRAEPNISVMHTHCELIITIGATRNIFFDASELENDFNAIVQSIENITSDNTVSTRDAILFEVRDK